MPARDTTIFASLNSANPPAGPSAELGLAVVLGGSVAGMLAARVLADHARTVLVIERDPAPGGDRPRRAVPQGAHPHGLLGAGARQLERWFPGFTERAVAGGACLVPSQKTAAYVDGVPKLQDSDVVLLTATRPFLEQLIRDELRAVPNVTTVTGRVTGLEFDGSAVVAVRYESDGTARRRAADLVVDALGRGSRVPDWLREAGWEQPGTVRARTGVHYSSALFRRPPGEFEVGQGVALSATEQGERIDAVFFAVEGDRYILTQAGYDGERPGSTAGDLIERCRTRLPPPFGAVAANGMVGEVVTYRQADSRRREYHACARLPARLLAVGDAVASFNPIYGQGMSSAALHASALSAYLRSAPDLSVAARDFFALQKVVVDAAWAISAGAGGTGWSGRLTTWATGRVVAATLRDRTVNRVFNGVVQMLRHPRELAAPGIIGRALLAGLRGRGLRGRGLRGRGLRGGDR